MPHATETTWSVEYDSVRRQKLFKNAPKDKSAYPALAAAVKPHVDSFNALFEGQQTLEAGLRDVGTQTFADGDPRDTNRDTPRNTLSLRLSDVTLERAVLPPTNKISTKNRNIYPAECRERHATYRGRLRVKLHYRINNGLWKEAWREMGQLPIMMRTNRCHLENSTPQELVHRKEESEELGGYFIVNGNEKLIRMLIVSRRNYPMAISRNAFAGRGPTFSKLAIQVRSVRPDQTSQTNVLHYLTDGNITLRFSWRKAEYLIPIVMILKALVETNDLEIVQGIAGPKPRSNSDSSFVSDRVELLLRTYKAYGLKTRKQTLAYLGEKFAPVLNVPITMSRENVGEEFLRKIVLPHLGNQNVTESQNNDKFRMLLFMIRKLYALAAGDCALDNADAVSNQEVLLGGFLYGMILKEQLQEWMASIGYEAREWCRRKPGRFADPTFEADFLSKVVRKTTENIARNLENFLATGNLSSPSGLDLQQVSGYTVVAEKINFYRFISHFRMIHRGSFFAQLKTTTVRKLLPESWGFLCPVHTPDGAPCGLLNHLAHQCQIYINSTDVSPVENALLKLGVSSTPSVSVKESVPVLLDGRIVGYCTPRESRTIAQTLRHWKVAGEQQIPLELEIGHIPTSNGGLYPGLFLFSQSARLLRPVKYLPLQKLDLVGPFEQPFMDIACVPSDVMPKLTTHIEFDPTNILSILANMTPFSDFNQSPRNMYQCQMSKQAMGTPGSSLRYRTDNKAYLLQTGQTPIVRPPLYNTYGLDNFPNGLNAVVAVLGYTGYDMDDAMIINKSSHERGFGDGCIYKTKFYPLNEDQRTRASKTNITSLFGFAPRDDRPHPDAQRVLDIDGLPIIGQRVTDGSIVAAHHSVMFNPSSGRLDNLDGKTSYFKYKDTEDAFIEHVGLIGSETGDQPCQTISIKYRIPRRPIIGDKFSSRHGQKGVCSRLYPSHDLPWSESGIVPDVIINPHAFPSRMTIGMFIESLAGKSGALHGLAQDSTPFTFSEEHTAGDFFGEQLLAAGFNFYGNEPMYSGVTGREFPADIYLGLVYYQRLRHMVSDKFQVRTTGPISPLTGQPVKGRSRGGGIRVGEMERDSLIAHGCAFLLQDRLMNCSDATRAWICRECGLFLGTQSAVNAFAQRGRGANQPSGIVRCRRCATEAGIGDSKMRRWEDGQGRQFVGGENTAVVAVPGVLRYLDVELAAMGVKMKFGVEP